MRNWTKLLFELCGRGGNSFAFTPGVKRLCVLPFHRYVHWIMPLCRGIVRALGHNAHEDATPFYDAHGQRPRSYYAFARVRLGT